MVDTQFYGYVSKLLYDAGHMITSDPVYTNHSASEALYIDSAKDVTTSRFDRTLLMQLSNISLLTELTWPGVVEDLTETIHIYSATIDISENNRSQIVADTHRLLHQYWDCHHSVVFYKNRNQYIISFANKDQSHVLSDWFDINVDYDEVVERIDTANISLESSISYFSDFIYTIAREYYLYPISVEEATYSMIPLTFVASAFGVKTEASKDDVKVLAKANLLYYETLYGDDYVAPVLVGYDEQAQFRRMATELDRISFELELAAELDEEVEVTFDDSDDDLGEFDDFEDEFDDDVDPAIFDDPVLMVKWLEQHQKHNGDRTFDRSKPPRTTTQKSKPVLEHDSVGNAADRRINEVVFDTADRQITIAPEDQPKPPIYYSHGDVDVNRGSNVADDLIKVAQIKRAEADGKRQEAYRLREEATQLMQDSISALSHLTKKRTAYESLCKKRDDAAVTAYSQKQQISDGKRNEANRLRSIAVNKRKDALYARKCAIDMRSQAAKKLQDSVSLSNKLTELRFDLAERKQKYLEAERLEAERREQERLEAERREQKRLEAERREQERLEAERREQERLETERRERERMEAERREQERLEAERREQERLEAERREQERLEAERREQERLEAERREQERLEAERREQERLETERREQERLEAERREQERLETERRERERMEAERREQERLEAERRERERLEAERREQERLEAERREQERLEAERRERERLEAERREQERLEAERRERERLEAERREQERLEAERRERERLEAERRQREELRQIHQKLLRIQRKKNEDLSAINSALDAVNMRLKEIEQRLSALTFLQFVEKRNLKAEQAELVERQTNLTNRYGELENKYKALFAEENRRYKDSVSQFHLQ